VLSYFFAFRGALVCVYTKDFPGSVIEHSDKLAAKWKTKQIASNGYTEEQLDQPLQFQVFRIQALTKEQIYMTQDPETDKEMKRLNRINNFDENSKGKQMKLLPPDRFIEQEFHEQVLTLRNLRTQVLIPLIPLSHSISSISDAHTPFPGIRGRHGVRRT